MTLTKVFIYLTTACISENYSRFIKPDYIFMTNLFHSENGKIYLES